MPYRMTFANRFVVADDGIIFQHTLRIPVKVKIVRRDRDNAEEIDWIIEFESTNRQAVDMFRKDLVRQLSEYLCLRTKQKPQNVSYSDMMELAFVKEIIGVNTFEA